MSNLNEGAAGHERATSSAEAPGSPAQRMIRLAVPTGILLALGVFGYRLAVAPIAAVGSAAECDRRYAEARTAADSNVVDLLSYPDTTRHSSSTRRRGRCGFRDPQVARDFRR